MPRLKYFDEQEVLEKAIQAFWNRGYEATSMQELTSFLGISRSSLYDTYKDKHTLFIRALERYQKTKITKIKALFENSGSVRGAIYGLLNFILAEADLTGQNKGCFTVNAQVEVAPHDAEVRDMVEHNDLEIEELSYNLLEIGKFNGELIHMADARMMARFIHVNLKGIHVISKSTSDSCVFEDIKELIISALD